MEYKIARNLNVISFGNLGTDIKYSACYSRYIMVIILQFLTVPLIFSRFKQRLLAFFRKMLEVIYELN